MTFVLHFLILLALVVSHCDSAMSQGGTPCRLVSKGADGIEATYGYNADGYVISMKVRDARPDSGGILPLSRVQRLPAEEYRYQYDASGQVVSATILRDGQARADTSVKYILKPAAVTKYVWYNGRIERSEDYDADANLISVRTCGYDLAGRLRSVLLEAPNPLAGTLKDFQYDGPTTNPTRMRIGTRNERGTAWSSEFILTYGPERAPERLLRGLPFDLMALEPWRQNAVREVYIKEVNSSEMTLLSQRVATQVNPQGYLTEIQNQIMHLTSVTTYHLENCP